MKLQNLKEIEQLMELCRKHGVETITVDTVTLRMGPIEDLKNTTESVTEAQVGFDFSKMTEDQIVNWSSGVPEVLNG